MERRNAGNGGMHGGPRNRPFPECASEVLNQVAKHCNQIGQQKWRSTMVQRHNELQHSLDVELFCVTADRRGTRLNPVQQLRLAQMLCHYFNEREKEGLGRQYTFFEVLFCGREGETLLHEVRITILQKLCSLALQYPCYSIYGHISTWLHKVANDRSHTYAQELVLRLVDQYVLAPLEWKLYPYLLPLAENSIEFASYFVVHSVNITTIQSPLVKVLEHWLSENYSIRVLAFIKETVNIAKIFAEQTFGLLVLYDCMVGDSEENALHGVVAELYVDWPESPVLQILPALKVAASAKLALNPELLMYHMHLAQKRGFLNLEDITNFLNDPEMKSRYDCLEPLLDTR